MNHFVTEILLQRNARGKCNVILKVNLLNNLFNNIIGSSFKFSYFVLSTILSFPSNEYQRFYSHLTGKCQNITKENKEP